MKDTTTLLILDMVNAFGFEGGDALLTAAKKISTTVGRLRQHVRRRGGTCVYVNDNFGHWRSDFRALVAEVARSRGNAVLEHLAPGDDDLFILKPKHSAFYQTPLPSVLEALQARSLVVCGIATEACVMATAMDAHMRDYAVRVPSNAVASASPARHRAALLLLRHSRIDTRPWRSTGR